MSLTHRTSPLALVPVAWMLAGQLLSTPAQAQTMNPDLKANLQQLAGQRVLFGHQSVGANLLSGVSTLAAQQQVNLPTPEVRQASELASLGLGHTMVAENTLPLKKIQSFEQALSTPAPGLKVAALKFCYVDFHAGTDVKPIFDAYQAMVSRIKAKNPQLKWVHVTVPLTTVQTGWKATLKQWLGKAPYGVAENLRREAYNQLLRQAYASQDVLFDLAKAESTRPDGSTWTVDWKGQQVPALVPGYSDDGEHLNDAGQVQVAPGFVAALARASRQP